MEFLNKCGILFDEGVSQRIRLYLLSEFVRRNEKKIGKSVWRFEIDGGKMDTCNSCYTYFKIVGDFNPDDVSEMLNLQPEKAWKIGDKRRNGTTYDFALWEIGRCNAYDVEVDRQMQKTISVLLDKIELLNRIKRENEVSFYLEVVPTIYVGDTNPCLAPSLDVIDFCYATRTEIDIDMYIMDSFDK